MRQPHLKITMAKGASSLHLAKSLGRRLHLLILILLVGIINQSCQQGKICTEGQQFLVTAMATENVDSSLYWTNHAVDFLEECRYQKVYAQAVLRKAKLLRKQKKHQEAIRFLDSSIKKIEKGVSLYDRRLDSLRYYLGRNYFSIKELDSARIAYRAAIKGMEGQVNSPLLVDCYSRIGQIVNRQLYYKKAISLQEKALEHAQKLAQPLDVEKLGKIYHALIVALYYDKQHQNAITYGQEAKKLLGLSEHRKMVLELLEIENLLALDETMGLEKRLNQLILGLTVNTDANYKKPNAHLRDAFGMLAKLYAGQKEHKKQWTALENALKHIKLRYKNKPNREVAKVHMEMAEFQAEQRVFGAALHHYQAMLANVIPSFSPESPYELPAVETLKPDPLVPASLNGMGKTLFLQIKEGKRELLLPAAQCYDLAFKAIIDLRALHSELENQTFLSGFTHDFFETAIHVNLALGQAEKAFQIAEMSKSVALKRLLGENDRSKAFAKTDIGAFQEKLRKNNSALIEYFLGDTVVFAFTLTPQGLYVDQLSNNKALEKQMSEFRRILEADYHNSKDSTQKALVVDFASLAKSLYESLMTAPRSHLPSETTSLAIIPDGDLYLLPFEVLLPILPQGGGGFGRWPFLLRDYAISYGYSSAMYFAAWHPTKEGQYIGFGPAYQKTTQDTPLARAQIKQAASSFQGRSVLEDNATKANFLSQGRGYDFVDFGGHGFYSTKQKNPLASTGIIFSKQDTLTAKELLKIGATFKTDLFFLGSCDSGIGAQNKGEAMMGLAWSFFLAGGGDAKLGISLWKVEEFSTSKIKQLFWEQVKRGLPYDEALQLAKLRFLSGPNNQYHFPGYWAGGVLYGNGGIE